MAPKAPPRHRPRRAARTATGRPRAKTAPRAKPKKVAPRRRGLVRRFAPADQLWHLVDPGQTEERTATAKGPGRARSSGPRTELASGARTICCGKPVGEVYAVATSKSALVPKPGDPPVRWCEGVK